MNAQKFTLDLDWKQYTVETGKLAQQTNWSCTVTVWDTVILATTCMKRTDAKLGFFPLHVAYQEKLYASWMISSSRFIKRESRPPESKTLTARLIDRGLRPLFPKEFTRETQVMLTILSYDKENNHDTAAWLAATVAFAISDIPMSHTNILLRVWLVEWKLVINPTVTEMETSDLDLLVTCTKENIVMIEAWANIISEEKLIEAMEFALEKWKKV